MLPTKICLRFLFIPFRVMACIASTMAVANAADICEAVAVQDVAAIESPDSVLKKGEIDSAITEYQVDKTTRQASFCSHGGYCYPTQVQIGAQLVDALKLTNCRVVEAQPYDDGAYLIYDLEPIRSANSAATLKYDDLDNKFLEMGLCNACADNVTTYYMKKPKSQCAKVARSALEGDPDAVQTLLNGPSFCIWQY